MGLYIPGQWDTLSRTERWQYVGTECAMIAANRHDALSQLGFETKASFPGFEMLIWGREEVYDFEQ